MTRVLKNIDSSTPLCLADLVSCLSGQVVSKTLVQNDSVSFTIFAFDQGEEISTHKANGDALVTILEGTGQITIDGTPHQLDAGQSIVMPAHTPHSVYAPSPFKMTLLVVS